MKLNAAILFSKFVSRLRMRMAAFLLCRDYDDHLQEFNALDNEDFVDEYIFIAQNFTANINDENFLRG